MVNPTHGPIDRSAILSSRVESLLESGAKPVSDTEVSAIEQEHAADAAMDAWSIDDLVKSFRASLTYGFDPTAPGIDRQTALGEARKHLLSLNRRRRKASGNVVEHRILWELKTALELERQARRDVMHYLVRPDSGGEALASAAARLSESMFAVENLARLFTAI